MTNGQSLWLPDRKPVPAENPREYLYAPGSYMQGLSGLVYQGRLHVYGDFGGGPQKGPYAPNHGEAHWMSRYPLSGEKWTAPEWLYLWRGHGGGEGAIGETYAPSIVLAPWGEWLDAYSGSMRIVPPEHAMTSRVAIGIARAPDLAGPWTPTPYVAVGERPWAVDPNRPHPGGVWNVALLVVGDRVLLIGRDSTRDGLPDAHQVWEVARDLTVRRIGSLVFDPEDRRSQWGNDAAITSDGRLLLLDSCEPGAAHKFRAVVEWSSAPGWTGEGVTVMRRTERSLVNPSGGYCWDGGFTRDERGLLVADGPLFANVAETNNPWARGFWRCAWWADEPWASLLAVEPVPPRMGLLPGMEWTFAYDPDLALWVTVFGAGVEVEWNDVRVPLPSGITNPAWVSEQHGHVRCFVPLREVFADYAAPWVAERIAAGEQFYQATVRGQCVATGNVQRPFDRGGGWNNGIRIEGRW